MAQPLTSPAALLAQSDRLAPEELDLGKRAQRTWLSVTGQAYGPLMQLVVRTPLYNIIARMRAEPDTKRRSDPLEQLDRLLVLLANRKYPESQLRLIEQHIGETITICYAGGAQRTPEEIDVDEQHHEGLENDLQTLRLTTMAAGDTPDPASLEAEALQCRLEASNSIEKARSLERDARTLRSGRPPRVRRIRQAEAS
jgi:hypothetical protein